MTLAFLSVCYWLTDRQKRIEGEMTEGLILVSVKKVLYDGNVTLVFSRESNSTIINAMSVVYSLLNGNKFMNSY